MREFVFCIEFWFQFRKPVDQCVFGRAWKILWTFWLNKIKFNLTKSTRVDSNSVAKVKSRYSSHSSEHWIINSFKQRHLWKMNRSQSGAQSLSSLFCLMLWFSHLIWNWCVFVSNKKINVFTFFFLSFPCHTAKSITLTEYSVDNAKEMSAFNSFL